MNTKKRRFTNRISILLPVAFLLFTCVSLAQNGKDAQWATAGKQGVGTSASLNSKVWFTLAQGVMTEVYYPDVTVANVHLLQFVVVNPKTKKVETEQDDAIHQVEALTPKNNPRSKDYHSQSSYSLTFKQTNTAKTKEWKIVKKYITDPNSDVVLIDVQFETKNKSLKLYVQYDPSLGNSGMNDTAWTEDGTLLSNDGDKFSCLVYSSKNNTPNKFTNTANGLFGVNDGLTQLRQSGEIRDLGKVKTGNVVQVAEVPFHFEALNQDWSANQKNIGISRVDGRFTLALAFAKSSNEALKAARQSLFKGYERTRYEYEQGWDEYTSSLPKVDPKYQAQFNMAAMILKAHEDKTIRGANIASLTVPWGGGANANENNIGGYHLIRSRDLYQVATAFMALGDKESAIRALDFLFKVQQKPDGSFPQNSFLDGKPFWGSLQLDEVAFPLILAHELGKTDKETYERHVKLAADFIVKNGPITPQERWEERTGYSPSTIAAEIAGLVCAAEIAKKNGDAESENRWLKTADEWQQNIGKWTVTTNGKYGDGNYYLRITQKGTPNAGDKIDLGNGAGLFDEREIVDAGFLELVRLGIKSPDDPLIVKSLKVIDDVIRVKTPNGDGFYRYNHDGYGEMDDGRRWNWDGKYNGKGRLWALLSGERGQYEIALANSKFKIQNSKLPDPKARLDSMLAFANEGLMIPEQIWDKAETPKKIDKQFVPELKFGEGTGSATPLAWSMAQFIRLAVNLKEGRNLDTPKVVYDRYVLGKKTEVSKQNKEFIVTQEQVDCFLAKSNFKTERSDQKFPVIKKCGEKTLYAVFAYKGNAEKVEVVGDFTNWQSAGLFLQQENLGPGGDKKDEYDSIKNIKYYVVEFAPTARVEYKLIVDGKWINDPLNPNKIDNGVGGENSFFTMPDYKETEWSKTKFGLYLSNKHIIKSKVYGKKEILVYVPEGFEKQTLPVLYIQDGSDYEKRTNALTIQRNLVKANKIKPFIMVFLDPKDRMKEYMANDDYAKFLAEEVVPVIDAKYKTIKSRDGRAVLGASLGGITAVNVGLKYPNVFGRIGGQSVSWWVDSERIVKDLDKLDGKTKFKFYIDDGTLEGVEDSRKAVEIMKKKGFDVMYVEGETGHNWIAWRDRLADAFIAIWQ